MRKIFILKHLKYKVTNILQHLKLFCSQHHLILKIVHAVQNHLLPEGLNL